MLFRFHLTTRVRKQYGHTLKGTVVWRTAVCRWSAAGKATVLHRNNPIRIVFYKILFRQTSLNRRSSGSGVLAGGGQWSVGVIDGWMAVTGGEKVHLLLLNRCER